MNAIEILIYVIACLSSIISAISIGISIGTTMRLRAMYKKTNQEIADHFDRYLPENRGRK